MAANWLRILFVPLTLANCWQQINGGLDYFRSFRYSPALLHGGLRLRGIL